MSEPKLIAIETICVHYKIEESFIGELDSMGLLQVSTIEKNHFVPQEQIGNLERIIRLHQELDLNLEAIDVVFNLLEKQKKLQEEINYLRKRLHLYE